MADSYNSGRSPFLARVVQCIPATGQALVCPIGGTLCGRDMKIARLPYTGTGNGVDVLRAYPEGAYVQCVPDGDDDPVTCDIVGPDSRYQPPGGGVSQDPASCVAAVDRDLVEKLCPGKLPLVQVWGRGDTTGLLPGDMDMLDAATGVGLSLRRGHAGLKGPAFAAARVTDDDRLLLSGTEVAEDTLLTERVVADGYSLRNEAVSTAEAVGMLSSDAVPFELSDQSGSEPVLAPTAEGAVPFYRLQEISGALADGAERTVSGAPAGTLHDGSQPPPVLSRDRVSLNGVRTFASATSIGLVKTPDIPAVSQLGYGRPSAVPGQDGAYDDLREPYEPGEREKRQSAYDELPEEDRVRDAALYRIMDRLLSDDYLDKLVDRLEWRGFSISRPGSQRQPVTAPTDAAELPLPGKLDPPAVDPVTGKVSPRYDTTSFITQEPDGSICICDGYGSEIRMSRGNIYISPALDLFLRPGRDLSAMSGRHQAYNSQGSLTLNTSDAAFVRAAGRLEVCAGTDVAAGQAGIVVESRDAGSDVVLHSAGGVSLSCERDMFIGRRAPDATGAPGEGVGQAAPASAGTMVLDAAGNGSLYVNGGTAATAEAMSVCVCAVGNDRSSDNSMVRMQGNGIQLAAKETDVMSSVAVRAPATAVSVGLPRSGEVRQVDMGAPAQGAENVVVGGSLVVGGNAWFNRQVVVCEELFAHAIFGTSELCSVVPDFLRDSTFKQQELPDMKETAEGISAASRTDGVAALQENGICNRHYLEEHGFAFPDDYGVDAGTVVPGMVWQQRLDPVAETWKELPVMQRGADAVPTMCYPGARVWESAKLSTVVVENGAERGEKVNLADGYRIAAARRNV